jgi:tripartite-type tricarboxylate transporter receptor subunit TctC
MGASAADYPTRPITLVVAFPPGGGADTQARLIAKGLTERLGRPVVVENRPGAGGAIATSAVARAAPDGYTLLIGSSSTLVLEPMLRPDSGFDAQRDFAAITVTAEMPLVLTVSPRLGVRTLSEFLALARQKPGQLTFASFGVGTTAHLVGEMLKASARVDLVHVPYKGSPEALIDLIGGQVSAAFTTTISAMGNIRAGKIVPLAVTGSKRLPTLPNVPTLAESGVSGISLEIWFAVLAPSKVPHEVLARLSKEIVSILKSPEVTRSIEEQGGIVIASDPGEVTQRLRSDVASISQLIKAANLRIDQ